LVVAEVALSLVLLIGAALMIRSFLSLQRVDPGFDRRNVLALDVFLTGAAYDSAYERTAFYRELMPRLAALPGVLNATASHAPPLSGSSTNSSITIEGQAVQHGEEPMARLQSVTANFIATLRVPLITGRDIEERDLTDSALVAVINQTMAERLWPGQDALGRRFRFGNSGDEWFTVVGVAADLKQRTLSDPRQNQVYVPYPHSAYRGMTLLLRTAADPTTVTASVRDAIRRVDPLLPVFDVQSMEAMYRFSTWEQRLYGGMFGSFAAIALLLASVGLYGVMAYMVTLRTHEIGVRMALGAERRHVLGLVVRRGLTLTGIGLAIGLVGAFALTRVLSNLLFGVTTTDPPSFLGIPAMLAAVALLASWVPARRAARVDPMLALRYE
jgi:putative ABC transport system permease protein